MKGVKGNEILRRWWGDDRDMDGIKSGRIVVRKEKFNKKMIISFTDEQE